MALQLRLSGRLTAEVGERDTAPANGSGDVPMLATSRLLSFAEAACCRAVEGHLEPGQTTVGTRVQLEHRLASPQGTRLTVQATLAHLDGRSLRFEVLAEDEQGRLVGHGQVTRLVVNRDRFLERASHSDIA
ncbi:MAG: thioesterase family protein [Actinomycetes bacterium]